MAQTYTISCRIPLPVKRSLDAYLDRHPSLSTQQVLKAALLRYLDHVSALAWEIPDRRPKKGTEAKFMGTFTSVAGDAQGADAETGGALDRNRRGQDCIRRTQG